MTDEVDHQRPLTRSPRNVRFVELSGEVMSALLDGDLSAASRMAGVTLTEYFVTGRARWLWRFRLGQIAADPGRARWMARQAVVGDEGLVVGHAGFHGPPDEVGMVDHGVRNSTFEATLSGAPFWNGIVRFRGAEPLLAHLRPGDQISGAVWRGDIVAVSKGGLRQATSREPGYDPQLTAALGTFTGLLAAQGLGFGAARLVRRRGHEPFTWLPYGRALFSVMALTCAAVGVPGWWLGFPWWVIPIVVAPVAALSARWLYRLWRPHRRPTAVQTSNQGGGPFRDGTGLS
ncbi:hypothetical protein [Streptomyces noursei]|uniref:hypothetical protein n=1 Tax=Streptomyces noursei TaxID=1971 RepID=UPI0037F43B8E